MTEVPTGTTTPEYQGTTEDDLQETISRALAEFRDNNRPFNGKNLLAIVRALQRKQDQINPQEYTDGLVAAAQQAKILGDRLGIKDVVDPALVAGVVDIRARNPPYATDQDLLAAVDAEADRRLADWQNYPYYDLYDQLGILHMDQNGIPYVEIYRSSGTENKEQIAAGLRSGNISVKELTSLPTSIRRWATFHDNGENEGINFADFGYAAESLEATYSADEVEAYVIGNAGHESTPYLSATRSQAMAEHWGTDNQMTVLHVPACLTLPVESLQQVIETDESGAQLPVDTEQEIAIFGRIRPEWIVRQL